MKYTAGLEICKFASASFYSTVISHIRLVLYAALHVKQSHVGPEQKKKKKMKRQPCPAAILGTLCFSTLS